MLKLSIIDPRNIGSKNDFFRCSWSMTVQTEAQFVIVQINYFFRISITKQLTTSDIIFERIQIQSLKFPETDMFHSRQWSGSKETAQDRAMIGNIPIRDGLPWMIFSELWVITLGRSRKFYSGRRVPITGEIVRHIRKKLVGNTLGSVSRKTR